MVAGPILKTPGEIERMKGAGRVVADALQLVGSLIVPGVSTLQLDRAVEDLIRGSGGIPAFLGYPSPTPGVRPFPASICVSINEEVVHGIPSENRKLKAGDIVSIDVGVEKDGFFGDAARTYPVGPLGRREERLLETGAEALARATAKMRPNTPLLEVSRAIQTCAEENHFSVVRKFVGHGIGRFMHEPPQVPNYVARGMPGRNIVLHPGAVLALEPMLNYGTSDVDVLEDGWTVVTQDRKWSVHFEDTVAVGADGPMVLTL
ncbi:MAG: type I methionyl aminopeptidase [Planctomycetota bacterium]